MTRFATLLAALLVLATAAPAVAEPTAADQVDLAVTATFDKPSYFVAEDVTMSVTVTNNGTATARNVVLSDSGNSPFTAADLAELSSLGTGVDIAPGQSVTVTATGKVPASVEVLTLTLEARSADQDKNAADNTATAEAAIIQRTGNLNGTVYGDRDGDKEFDAGEGLAGVVVQSGSGDRVRTDAAGRFAMRDVPEGTHSLQLGLPSGWTEGQLPSVDVHAGEDNEAFIRAVRPSTALRATMAFDQRVYAVGDPVRQRVTLTNTGRVDLAGITARCLEGAAPNVLSGLGWGDLVHYERPGVTVRAGETRTFDFDDVVPPGGRLYGYITMSCRFSTAFRYDDGPEVTIRADVPGGVGGTGGYLYVDRDTDMVVDPGEPIQHTKLFLVADDGRVAGRAATDATGHFFFANVPANNYELRVAGPWRPAYGTFVRLGVFDGDAVDDQLYPMLPGPTQPDLDRGPTVAIPGATVAPRPTPQAAPRPANLADTGASIGELAVLGVLMLLAGALLVFVRPREA